ncbi:MAG TPA: HAMP domain-containing sensor histidine kinase [Caulobacteraceae bacterium]
MRLAVQRGLFWRVYATLLASLLLAAMLAALVWRRQMVIVGRAHLAHAGAHHLLTMLLTIAGAVGLAAYPVVARLTRRLENLKASLDAWGEGQLGARAEAKGHDEIAAVASSFNIAADRIERLLSAHRDLLAHASHELRSPLARLGVAVEIYAAQPDPALRLQIVKDIAELSALVDEILLASRLDQSPGAAADERVDCLELAAEEAARAGISVRRQGPSDISFEIAGSPRLIRRMIRNLIDNAVRHGLPPVEVELSRADRPAEPAVIVVVNDAGPGIDEAERERVFEPFYRPAGRAEADGGWGLGLSIVRQIAQRHGGVANCETGPDGARFVITLPVTGKPT